MRHIRFTRSKEKREHRIILCARIALLVMAAVSGLLAQQDKMTVPIDTSRQASSEATSIMQSVSRVMSNPVLQKRNPRYMLRAGDVLEINFVMAPAFNQVRTVQPDGYIALQNVGDLHVAGKTTPELVEALREKYAAIMRDPVISVVLKEFEHPYFIASGQVGKPGKYELRGATTVSEAIAIAGGFGDVAKSSNVLLFRRVSNEYVDLKQLNVKKILQGSNLEEDIELQPGDMVFVPKSTTAAVLRSLMPHSNLGLYLPLGDR